MQKDIHPNYRPVVFKDMGGDFAFLTRSTIESNETIEWEDGNTYPLIKVEISSATHPFYTGKMMLIDTAGMVERYRRRYGQVSDSDETSEQPAEGSTEATQEDTATEATQEDQ